MMRELCNMLLQCVLMGWLPHLRRAPPYSYCGTSWLLPYPCRTEAPWWLGRIHFLKQTDTSNSTGPGGGQEIRTIALKDCSPSRFNQGRANCSKTEGRKHAQVEAVRGAEQEARAAAEEVEALRRTISQLPQYTVSVRSAW